MSKIAAVFEKFEVVLNMFPILKRYRFLVLHDIINKLFSWDSREIMENLFWPNVEGLN